MLHPLPKNRVSTLAFTTHPPRCCEDHARLVADKLANGKDGQKKPGGLRPKIAIAMAHPCLRVRSANDTCAAVRSANGFPNGSRMRKTRASSLRRLDASTVSVRAPPRTGRGTDNRSLSSRSLSRGAGLHERRTFGDQHVRTPLQRLRGEAKGKCARQQRRHTRHIVKS